MPHQKDGAQAVMAPWNGSPLVECLMAGFRLAIGPVENGATLLHQPHGQATGALLTGKTSNSGIKLITQVMLQK